MEASSSYNAAAAAVKSAKVSAAPKKGGKVPKRRSFNGRVMPKAALRKLALKANISRMSDETYPYIDKKVYNVMENVLYDAIAITHAGKANNKGKNRIIKERHMVRALERRGAIGLGTTVGRRTL